MVRGKQRLRRGCGRKARFLQNSLRNRAKRLSWISRPRLPSMVQMIGEQQVALGIMFDEDDESQREMNDGSAGRVISGVTRQYSRLCFATCCELTRGEHIAIYIFSSVLISSATDPGL